MAPKRRKVKPPDWVGENYDAQDEDNTDSGVATSDSGVATSKERRDQFLSVSMKDPNSASAVSMSCNAPRKKCIPGAGTSQGDGENQLSSSDIMALSMPFLQFKGSLVYSYNSGDCSLLCEDILSTLSGDDLLHVGFDLEWPVSYIPGSASKVALVQICTAEDKCYLFHIAAMGDFPQALKTLISHNNVIKYGINIEADLWKLGRDFDIPVREIIRKSVKDLSIIANEKLKSSERWTLDGLSRNVISKRLDKNPSVRCGKWDEYPLSEEQRQYAAADAYACLLLANHLLKLQN